MFLIAVVADLELLSYPCGWRTRIAAQVFIRCHDRASGPPALAGHEDEARYIRSAISARYDRVIVGRDDVDGSSF